MRGDDDPPGTAALRKAGGDGEHDPVPEGDHRTAHRLLLIMPVGNLPAAPQHSGLKLTGHKIQRGRLVGNPRPGALPGRHGQLTGMVLRPIVEAKRRHHLVCTEGIIKGGDGVNSAAQQDDDLHLLFLEGGTFLTPRVASCTASTRMPMPPRGEKSPTTTACLGAIARTTSSRMRLVIPSAKTAWFR